MGTSSYYDCSALRRGPTETWSTRSFWRGSNPTSQHCRYHPRQPPNLHQDRADRTKALYQTLPAGLEGAAALQAEMNLRPSQLRPSSGRSVPPVPTLLLPVQTPAGTMLCEIRSLVRSRKQDHRNPGPSLASLHHSQAPRRSRLNQGQSSVLASEGHWIRDLTLGLGQSDGCYGSGPAFAMTYPNSHSAMPQLPGASEHGAGPAHVCLRGRTADPAWLLAVVPAREPLLVAVHGFERGRGQGSSHCRLRDGCVGDHVDAYACTRGG